MTVSRVSVVVDSFINQCVAKHVNSLLFMVLLADFIVRAVTSNKCHDQDDDQDDDQDEDQDHMILRVYD